MEAKCDPSCDRIPNSSNFFRLFHRSLSLHHFISRTVRVGLLDLDGGPYQEPEGSAQKKYVVRLVHRRKICSYNTIDAANNMCSLQLTAMLGCWAATGDIHSKTACQETAQALFHCMRTTVSFRKVTYHGELMRRLCSQCPRRHTNLPLIIIWLDWGRGFNRFDWRFDVSICAC